MKITEFKFVEHIVPKGSCGTGYSEPDKFHVITDTGFETDIYVDIWYRPKESIYEEFLRAINRKFEKVDNLYEVWEMYKQEMKLNKKSI